MVINTSVRGARTPQGARPNRRLLDILVRRHVRIASREIRPILPYSRYPRGLLTLLGGYFLASRTFHLGGVVVVVEADATESRPGPPSDSAEEIYRVASRSSERNAHGALGIFDAKSHRGVNVPDRGLSLGTQEVAASSRSARLLLSKCCQRG